MAESTSKHVAEDNAEPWPSKRTKLDRDFSTSGTKVERQKGVAPVKAELVLPLPPGSVAQEHMQILGCPDW